MQFMNPVQGDPAASLLLSLLILACTFPACQSQEDDVASEPGVAWQLLLLYKKAYPLCEDRFIDCIDSATTDPEWSVCYNAYVRCKDNPTVQIFPREDLNGSLFPEWESNFGPLPDATELPASFESLNYQSETSMLFGRVRVLDSAIEVSSEVLRAGELIGTIHTSRLQVGEHMLVLDVNSLNAGSYEFVVRSGDAILLEQIFTIE